MSRLNTKRDKGAGSTPKKGGRVKRNTGKDTAAKIDASDTYPVTIIVITVTATQNGNAVGNRMLKVIFLVFIPVVITYFVFQSVNSC